MSEVMGKSLEFEANRRSINITLNSFATQISRSDRKNLYSNFGRLYPEGTLMLPGDDDSEGVGLAYNGVQDYELLF